MRPAAQLARGRTGAVVEELDLLSQKRLGANPSSALTGQVALGTVLSDPQILSWAMGTARTWGR